MAVTGKGNWPFVSGWAFRRLFSPGTDLPRKIAQQPTNVCGQLVYSNWFFDSGDAPSYYGTLRRWTGATWAKAKLYVYTGSWASRALKRWDGSSWKTVDTTGV